MADDPTLDQRLAAFGDELIELVAAVVPTTVSVGIDKVVKGDRVVALVRLNPSDWDDDRQTLPKVSLTVGGVSCAALAARMTLRSDSSGRYLATTSSAFALYGPEREPLVRMEYFEDTVTRHAKAHWQIHAERGALSHVLTLAGKDRHSLPALHLPVGGTRMRPCFEDFLQFAIEECGVDAVDGYATALEDGRQRWRERQIAVLAREAPEIVAQTLIDEHGYQVVPPEGGHPPARRETLRGI
jgi:hypothetical protein